MSFYPDGLEYDHHLFKKQFIEIYSKLFDSTTTNGIMFEPFTFLYQRRFDRKNVIDRINSIYPDIKIITFIRNQKSWLLSHYSQYLKSGGLLSSHDFIECQLNNPYLEAHYIDWFPLISYLYTTFGQENVLVCLYEDLKKSPQGVADKIFAFLEVNSASVNPEKVNPSLTYHGLALRRFLNFLVHFDCGASSYSFNRDIHNAKLSLYSKVMHKFIYSFYKPYTNKLCYLSDNFFKCSKKTTIEKSHLSGINSRYADNNKKLSGLLKIDLNSYDYPMP